MSVRRVSVAPGYAPRAARGCAAVAWVATVFPLVSAPAAHAAFTGAYAQSLGTIQPGSTTYRVIATFNSPLDQVATIYGAVNPLVLSVTGGSIVNGELLPAYPEMDFYQGGLGPWGPFQQAHDSWLSLGLDPVLADVATSPGWPVGQVVAGTGFSLSGAGYFDANPGPGSEVYAGASGEVVIAQFTVTTGAGFTYSGMLHYWPFTVLTTEDVPFHVQVVPAPGAAAVIATALPLLSRRRRRPDRR